MASFRGLTRLNVDAKGRVAIPKAYREKLAVACDNAMVITADVHGCLLLYPEPEWQDVETQINSLPNAHPLAREYQRIYIGYADDQTIDASGRIMVSQELRDYAEIDRRVFLVGQGRKFELWSEPAWEARIARTRQQIDDMDPDQIPDSLLTIKL